jgi:ParB-like chromosome segregation protein Spo0J
MANKLKIRYIAPKEIMIPETRVNAQMDSETDSLFRESIRVAGVKEPILCQELNDQLILVDGLHRLMAAIDVNLPKVPIALIEGTEKGVMLDNLVLNRLRGKISTKEILAVLRELSDQHHITPDEIEEITGFSASYTKRLTSIANASDAVFEALDRGQISLEGAYWLSQIPGEYNQTIITHSCLATRMTTEGIRHQVEAIHRELQKPPEERRPLEDVPPVGIECIFCGGEYPINEIENPNICKGCLALLKQPQIAKQPHMAPKG